MSFHAKTLKLLGLAPVTSPSAVAELDAIERRIGRRLPLSVREWYSRDDACELLDRYSNGDPPLDPREFGIPREDTHGAGPHDLLASNLIVFRYENQAVCVWAFELDGSEDPPVYVDVETQFRCWTKCTPTFSDHLHCWMWDYTLVLTVDLLVAAVNPPLSQTALDFLRANFDVGPATFGWPGHTQFRFSREKQRVLVWAAEDQADWWLAADDQESLRQLVRTVSDWDQVGRSLYHRSDQGRVNLSDLD